MSRNSILNAPDCIQKCHATIRKVSWSIETLIFGFLVNDLKFVRNLGARMLLFRNTNLYFTDFLIWIWWTSEFNSSYVDKPEIRIPILFRVRTQVVMNEKKTNTKILFSKFFVIFFFGGNLRIFLKNSLVKILIRYNFKYAAKKNDYEC